MSVVAAGMEPDRCSAAVKALVRSGLWQRVRGGWTVPADEWAQWQTTKEEVEAAREQRVAVARKAASARWHGKNAEPMLDACSGDAHALPEHCSMHACSDAQRQRAETETETETSSLPSEACAERPQDAVRTGAPPRGNEPAVMDFPAKGGTFRLTGAKLAEYARTFADGDEQAVLRELRHARQWLVDNPPRRKSLGGVAAFLTRWLARANDRGSGGFPRARDRDDRRPDHLCATFEITDEVRAMYSPVGMPGTFDLDEEELR